MAFKAGFDLAVKVTLAGGTVTTLKVTGYDFGEENNTLITTHTGTSGFQSRIAGITDLKGNITANVDVAAFPWNTTAVIKAGTKGQIDFYVNSTPTLYTLQIIVAKVHYQSKVDGLLEYNFDVEMDNTAASSTPITYP